jgi:hypothetical protein
VSPVAQRELVESTLTLDFTAQRVTGSTSESSQIRLTANSIAARLAHTLVSKASACGRKGILSRRLCNI